MIDVTIDASDLVAFRRALGNAGGDITAKAMARAMRRITTMARTEIVRTGAKRVKLPPGIVRARTTAHFNAGGNTVEVVERSNWIALWKLGATQTRKGVRVRTRGSYAHAFIATMKSGHVGVYRRGPGFMDPDHAKAKYGRTKHEIRELFGPNPAHDVTNNQDEYLQVLASIIDKRLLPRFIHELDQIAPWR